MNDNYAAVAGLNGEAAVYSIEADNIERQVAVNEPVTDTIWTDSKLIFATSQGTVKVFENGSEVASASEHSGPATALSIHPSGEIVGSVGTDKSIVFYEVESLKRVSRAYADSCKLTLRYTRTLLLTNSSFNCLCFPSRWTSVRGWLRFWRCEALHDQDS